MSELSSEFVYQGFWVDYSQGPILGATITVTSAAAIIIVVSTTILISLATSHLWNVLVFLGHQLRAARNSEDALFRQQQVLLRSMPTPGSAIVDFAKLAWFWRKNVKSSWSRNLIPAMLAVAYGLISLAASVGSSLILDTTDIPVLIRSSYCAYDATQWLPVNPDASQFDDSNVIEYARRCIAQSQGTSGCNIFSQRQIDIQVSNISCPFAESVCFDPQLGLRLDSGPVDAGTALGINIAAQDQVTMRKQAQCAPLQIPDYLSYVNSSLIPQWLRYSPLAEETFAVFHYGDSYVVATRNLTSEQLKLVENVTAAHTNFASIGALEYAVFPVIAYEGLLEHPEYTPIDPLKHTQADVGLVMLFSNQINYAQPVYDPVFRATTPSYDSIIESNHLNYYFADYPAGALACITQYQFCAAGSQGEPECHAWAPVATNFSSVDVLPNANSLQKAIIKLLQNSAFKWDLETVGSQSPPVLDASWSSSANSGLLPDNQWQVELQLWDSVIWTGIQSNLARFALGNVTGSFAASLPPETEGEKRLCNSIKMTKPGDFA